MSGILHRIGLALCAACLAHIHAEEYNVLTAAEQAQGWQLMFDGKSLAGWHSYGKATIVTGGWVISDSAIYRRDQAAGGILAPEKFVYQDFDLSIDWKVPDAGNSGIFIRYLESETSENIRTGPESQICGKLHPDYKDGMSVTSAGACYAMYPPAKPWIKSEDQYNNFHVIAFGKRIAHYGNGAKLLEYEIGTPDWTARYEASKYNSFPLYGDVHAGKLFLQDHGSQVWFRNLKIRPLTVDPWSDASFVWPDQAAALKSVIARKAAPRLLAECGLLRLDVAAADWEWSLIDASGRRGAFSKGFGAPTLNAGPAAGTYFLSGSVAGAPFFRRIELPAR